MNVGSASVTDTLRTAALIGQRGESLASEAEASAIVCTTPKGDSVRNASQAFTEIPTDRTPPPTPANHVIVTPWAQCPSTWQTARSVTPQTGTASANQASAEPTATGVWWDTGAFTNTDAVHVNVQETVIRLLETACLALIWSCTTWTETPVSQSESSERTNSSLLFT